MIETHFVSQRERERESLCAYFVQKQSEAHKSCQLGRQPKHAKTSCSEMDWINIFQKKMKKRKISGPKKDPLVGNVGHQVLKVSLWIIGGHQIQLDLCVGDMRRGTPGQRHLGGIGIWFQGMNPS